MLSMRVDLSQVPRPHSCAKCDTLVIRETDITEGSGEIVIANSYSDLQNAAETCPFSSALARMLQDSEQKPSDPVVARFDQMWKRKPLYLTPIEKVVAYATETDDVTAGVLTTIQIRPNTRSEGAFAQAAKWVDECYTSHRFCGDLRDGFAPSRLIEVGRNGARRVRLVERADLADQVKWACLSYVWGGPQEVRATTSTLRKYIEEGIEVSELPPTLVDAVEVCRRLNIPYVWIDALRIIQDDRDDLLKELQAMPEIYQQGYLTICASRAGSVRDGFLGEQAYSYEVLPPTKVRYEAKDGRTGHVLLLEDNYKHFMLSNPINGRAWTFQEALLSPRKLCYSRDMMHWYCRSAQRFDGDWKKKDRLYATDKYDWTIDNDAPIPCVPRRPMPALEPIAQQYSNRAMTKSSDKLAALSAIAKTVADRTGYTYLAGLFKEQLPLQLCWMADEGMPMPRPKTPRAPSWSWAAVDASIRFNGTWWFPIKNESTNGRTGAVVGWVDEADGVEVLSAHVVPTSPGSEFFSVESGRLELKAVVRKIEYEVHLRDGTGEALVDGHVMRCMSDAWEEDWPSRDGILELTAASGPHHDNDDAAALSDNKDADVVERDDDTNSIASDASIFYHTVEAYALLIKKSRRYNYVDEFVADGSSEFFDRDGILLRQDGDHYQRIGSCKWGNLERHMFDCEAADLPGWEMRTVTVF